MWYLNSRGVRISLYSHVIFDFKSSPSIGVDYRSQRSSFLCVNFRSQQQPTPATLFQSMNISAPSAGIIPDGATPASRLEDVPPPIDLKHRDPDYYKAPLVILVSPIAAFHGTLVSLSFFNLGGSNLVQSLSSLFRGFGCVPSDIFVGSRR